MKQITKLYIGCYLVIRCCPLWAAPELTFGHITDIHVPHANALAQEAIAALPTGGPVELTPYNITVPVMSLVIATGDLTEFGGGNGWWEQYLSLWNNCPVPVLHQTGNHDNTWDCSRSRIRALHGSPFYVREYGGIKLIGLDTATPQDPRPTNATEGLLWLEDELRRTPAEQPVIVFCHHPTEGGEFSGAWERARFIDLLQEFNVSLLLVGHGHGTPAWKIGGVDTVMGGTTFGDNRGFGIISVKDGKLRVCHQFLTGEKKLEPRLDKDITPGRPEGIIARLKPVDGYVFGPDETLFWSVALHEKFIATSGKWWLDGADQGELQPTGNRWYIKASREGLAPGAHTVRFELNNENGLLVGRTLCFWLDDASTQIVWKTQVSANCQATPLYLQGKLYVGANDGGVYCFDAATGEFQWRIFTGGEVQGGPVASPEADAMYVGSSNGIVRCLTLDGQERWQVNLGQPVYSPATVKGDLLYLTTTDGSVFALNRKTGEKTWQNDAPEYAVETACTVTDDTAYIGAWDRFVYAINLSTGELRWRQPGKGSEGTGGSSRYYSPADCSPAYSGGNLFVTDRAYWLAVMKATDGSIITTEEKCAAACTGADGSVYIRHTDGRVSKRTSDNAVLWTASVPTGSLPVTPLVANGKVYILSSIGTLSVINDSDGTVLKQYKVFPDCYAFAAPATDGANLYMVDHAGQLLALKLK